MQIISSLISWVTTPIRAVIDLVSEITPGFRALSRWSLPTKWSLVTLLFLLIVLAARAIMHYVDILENKNWLDGEKLFVIGSIILIPTLVFYLVKYLLMEEVSPFPDLDSIWYDGIKGAMGKGVSVYQTPIFLILGTKTDSVARNLLSLSKLNFVFSSSESGEPPISVHASSQGIFVAISSCNRISRLASKSSNEPVGEGPLMDSSGSDGGGTIGLEQLNEMKSMDQEKPMDDVPGGTLLDDFQGIHLAIQRYTATKSLSSQDDADSERRLRHVCQLIQRTRSPLCPINGLLTVLPVSLIEGSPGSLVTAMQKDMAVLRESLQVRCPNTALITEMESEEGFIELMKRLPARQVSDNRFGEGADLWVVPESDRLGAIATRAVGKFEDWIYKLFQHEGALKKKGNAALFTLLSRSRGPFATNLKDILRNGFGFNLQTNPELAHEQFLFGGCYFAATGYSSTTQGFVRSLFADKMCKQEGEVEWSPEARLLDQKYQMAANFAALVGTLSFIAIVVMFLVKYWPTQ